MEEISVENVDVHYLILAARIEREFLTPRLHKWQSFEIAFPMPFTYSLLQERGSAR